ncbi:hypothetical protein GCM10009835_30650 [Planosporangium flavigriseum]|uniref:Uncharacterized protein n=1 Tax=Planosporangium flavigriseum TaxID=373681 RepID=A0A8J3LRQ4_9ACTN|nr:hypothetical protein Pfl04_52260 [Planosporangium flavigriseum]
MYRLKIAIRDDYFHRVIRQRDTLDHIPLIGTSEVVAARSHPPRVKRIDSTSADRPGDSRYLMGDRPAINRRWSRVVP